MVADIGARLPVLSPGLRHPTFKGAVALTLFSSVPLPRFLDFANRSASPPY